MRLLNVNTRQLEEFFGDVIPKYAILSHTWGTEEVTLQDLSREGHEQKHGYSKIEGCCQQAAKEKLRYVWIDTCCIDKTSSAELSEAINSMFRWYEAATVCYAYLQDVPPGMDPVAEDSAFRKSRWFTRGWTLQELLAPRRLEFYASDWMQVFPPDMVRMNGEALDRRETEKRIALLSGITRIPESILRGYQQPSSVSAACKFSWAADRNTTRVEDQAYCLLGLLGINMPLLYGEGSKAFLRLQEAVLGGSDDISVLAWGYDMSWKLVENEHQTPILARSPAEFLRFPTNNTNHMRHSRKTHTTVTGHGLHIELSMVLLDAKRKVWLGIIEEHLIRIHEVGHEVGIAIVLKQRAGRDTDIFERADGCPPIPFLERRRHLRPSQNTTRKLIYLRDKAAKIRSDEKPRNLRSYLSLTHRPSRPGMFIPTISLSIKAFILAGYFLSSLWPPTVVHQPTWLQLGKKSAQLYSTLILPGPQTKAFFFIFANRKDRNRFAVRTKVQWPLRVEVAFCKLDVEYHRTALEHCCDTKLGWRSPPFHGKMQWNSHIPLDNDVTLETGHVRATELPPNSFGGHYSLVWVKGDYQDEG